MDKKYFDENFKIMYEYLDKRFDGIDKRFLKIENKIDTMQVRVDLLQNNFEAFKKNTEKFQVKTNQSLDQIVDVIDGINTGVGILMRNSLHRDELRTHKTFA